MQIKNSCFCNVAIQLKYEGKDYLFEKTIDTDGKGNYSFLVIIPVCASSNGEHHVDTPEKIGTF